MKVKFKKNITVKGIEYLQGMEYTITQEVFEFVSTHVIVIEKPEIQETIKNKIPKNVNKK